MFETLHVNNKTYVISALSEIPGVDKLPYSLLVLLENVVRNVDDTTERSRMIDSILSAAQEGVSGPEIEFMPARVLLTDFTGVPCMVDFAAMRDALADVGGNPADINPLIQADLVIDHSVIADTSGCACAAEKNAQKEFERNKERYAFLKWAQQSFKNVRIVPPDTGICHQLNLERLSYGVYTAPCNKEQVLSGVDMASQDLTWAYPDSLIGADSHTTTVNGIGVTGWGVGGIEAEAAMLGQPVTILVPQVVGVKLTGELSQGVGAMDVALTFAERLREMGVVGKFVECYGPGLSSLSANDRATISNMSPEYGCTVTLFPFDDETLAYYAKTGRSQEQVALIEAYAKRQNLWHTPEYERTYATVLEFDLSQVEPSLSGPSRPQDRFSRKQAKQQVYNICATRGLDIEGSAVVADGCGNEHELTHGAIAIAAITSCTTTANPDLIVTAGLLAQNAVRAGLSTKPWIKKMWSPGSYASELILKKAGLLDSFEQLGFFTAGFGCMSCIGNSGPLTADMQAAGKKIELAAVLSGNRNFEGRIGPDISQNYLMSPANVIAYALAGTVNFDFEAQPLGRADKTAVYLSDIMPKPEEVRALIDEIVTADLFDEAGQNLYEGTKGWQSLSGEASSQYAWDESSTYVRKPPYFNGFTTEQPQPQALTGARVLIKAGDFITTDHISPAGSIAPDSPAALYLSKRGVAPEFFNTYGSRRGNHEVMMRGTFANTKMRNELAQGKVGGYTTSFVDDGEIRTVWGAACAYAQHTLPLVVFAGKMYGSGSSRDWAAKGPQLLGVKAVFAESFERIHRSNLIGMGIIPFQFLEGQTQSSLGLMGDETVSIPSIDFTSGEFPRTVEVEITSPSGETRTMEVLARVDTPTEGQYLAHGGILTYMLRKLAK